MNGVDLLGLAFDYIGNVKAADHSFGDQPTELSRAPWRTRTMCSTLITALEREAGRKSEVRVQLYGKAWPRAKDYHAAILTQSGFAKIQTIDDVRPGDLIAIRFRTPLDSFSGHCALVSGTPQEMFKGQWKVSVVDSTNSPHGALDPRATANYRGLGAAHMLLLVDENRTITGYRWSSTSEARLIADGERMVAVGRWI